SLAGQERFPRRGGAKKKTPGRYGVTRLAGTENTAAGERETVFENRMRMQVVPPRPGLEIPPVEEFGAVAGDPYRDRGRVQIDQRPGYGARTIARSHSYPMPPMLPTLADPAAVGSIPRNIIPCPRDWCTSLAGASAGSRYWMSNVVRASELVLTPEPCTIK